MYERTRVHNLKDIIIKDIRIKCGEELKHFPDKEINYRKLIQFLFLSFPQFNKENYLIIVYTNLGLEKSITNNYDLNDAIINMKDQHGIILIKSKGSNYIVNQDVFKSDLLTDEDLTKVKNDVIYSPRIEYYIKYDDELKIDEEKNKVKMDNLSKVTMSDIILNQSSEDENNLKNDELEKFYKESIEETSEENTRKLSPKSKVKKNIKYNIDHFYKNEYLSDAKVQELKKKYSNSEKREKATRFSRIRGKNELCNTKREQDIFEEWLVVSKARIKQHIKRYSEDTTLAIFFDKFSVNIRIRIQLYTHKSKKAKKTSQTFTFYKNGIDENWSIEVASGKLENFLRFGLENLFEIKGPINLDDF